MFDAKELSRKAVEAKSKAVATYSNFHVGAALITNDGKIYQGANIENSSYGLTICAERTAVFTAVLEGERNFKAIAVAGDTEDFLPPCGACRQVLADLCGKDLEVILTNQKGEINTFKLGDLLPYSFGEDFLKS
ncbi:MAG: cytidine deaminase [Ignavibacteriae bacterium HGW-Ignavibacteriae-3]|nr:MAG: cytidine deaminase [Ignavibacteriae bacterium HGW-Ignavibacteriae-3]